MNKLMVAVIAATLVAPLAYTARAEEGEDKCPLSFGVDVDVFSAYIWHNQVANDDWVAQPCVWADFTLYDADIPVFNTMYVGLSAWQNYDITDRRREAMHAGLTETDYNIHLGGNIFTLGEDDDYALTWEVGHEWFVNHRFHSAVKDYYHSLREVYAKVAFENPIIDPYAGVAWQYQREANGAMYYEVGLNREFEFWSILTLGLDANFSFGNGRYLTNLYGVYKDYETEEELKAGVGGVTAKAYLVIAITDWFSIKGTVAYTGVLNKTIRDDLGEDGTGWEGDRYKRDIFWGGISANFEF